MQSHHEWKIIGSSLENVKSKVTPFKSGHSRFCPCIRRIQSMSILPIVHYPEAVLLEVGKPVGDLNEELERLVADMFVTMEDAGGVGLAAPQVGVSRRLFVMDTPNHD